MKKKLLFIIPAMPGGGTEKVLIDILRNMDYEHYEITMFMEFGDGVYMNDIPAEVEILYLFKQHSVWHDRLFRLLRATHTYIFFHSTYYKSAAQHLLKGRKFDTIISFLEGNALRFHSYLLGQSKRNISWIHIDLKKKHWSLQFFKDQKEEQNTYQEMDNIVCVSNDVEKALLEMYPSLKDKCTVIYNLIDRKAILREAASIQVRKDKFTICMVGRLNRQKRYDRALAVMKKLKEERRDFELWILGSGDLENSFKEMVQEYNIEKNVRFLGFVKPPYAYMKCADLYLNTSEAEGYPLVICEALCLALPVVATNISGNYEILSDSKYGILTDETEESIYQGIKKVMDDMSLRKQYSQKALERSAMFDVSATMSAIERIL